MTGRMGLLVGLLISQGITQSGQPAGAVTPCTAQHVDLAINNQVVLTVPRPPRADWFVYICGWDWQVVENATGTAQTNVLWTTTNLGGVAAEYSVAATPNALVSGNFTYPTPVKADASGMAVIFLSPAAAANTAYSLNVYRRYGP